MMRRWGGVLLVAGLLGVLGGGAKDAWGFAQGWQKYVKNVEVYINDSFHAMDGDMNLGFIAPRPDQHADAWLRYHLLFWDDAYHTRMHTGIDPTGGGALWEWSHRLD